MTELQRAVTLDDQAEVGIDQGLGANIDEPIDAEIVDDGEQEK